MHYVRAAFRSVDTQTNQSIVNVISYEVAPLTSPPNYVGIAVDIRDHLLATYTGLFPAFCTLQDVTATEYDYPGSTPAQGVAGIGTSGSRSTPDTKLDPALCPLLSLRTATPKRYARGHLFLPPVFDTAELANGGKINTGGTLGIAINNFIDALKDSFTVGSTDYAPIIFSRRRVQLNQTPFTFPVTSVTWDARQHWLRKRNTGS